MGFVTCPAPPYLRCWTEQGGAPPSLVRRTAQRSTDSLFTCHPTAGQASSVICATRQPNRVKPAQGAERTMSRNGGDASKASSPGRPRHQITRSISEISSPTRLHRHHSHRATREAERDARTPAPQSTIPGVQARRSFEWSRSEGVTPNLSPNASRRTSILYASADEVMLPAKAPRDSGLVNGLTREQQRAAARERLASFLQTFFTPRRPKGCADRSLPVGYNDRSRNSSPLSRPRRSRSTTHITLASRSSAHCRTRSRRSRSSPSSHAS